MLELVRGDDCGLALPCDLAMPVGVCAGLVEGNALREVLPQYVQGLRVFPSAGAVLTGGCEPSWVTGWVKHSSHKSLCLLSQRMVLSAAAVALKRWS